MVTILLSDLAVEQLADLPPTIGRPLLDTIQRLRTFPLSAPRLEHPDYSQYRQIVIQTHRAIYRYHEEENMVRVYCILHTRRRIPPPEFLSHQIF